VGLVALCLAIACWIGGVLTVIAHSPSRPGRTRSGVTERRAAPCHLPVDPALAPAL